MKSKRLLAFILLFAILFSVPAYAASSRAKKVVKIAAAQLGKPYSYESDAPHAFNCASLVMYCFNKVKKGTLSTKGVRGKYETVEAIADLDIGDIVCYRIDYNRIPEVTNFHFGIYCGRGYFIHAAASAGVTCSRVDKYEGRFLCGLRIF